MEGETRSTNDILTDLKVPARWCVAESCDCHAGCANRGFSRQIEAVLGRMITYEEFSEYVRYTDHEESKDKKELLDNIASWIDDWYGGGGDPKPELRKHLVKFAESYPSLQPLSDEEIENKIHELVGVGLQGAKTAGERLELINLRKFYKWLSMSTNSKGGEEKDYEFLYCGTCEENTNWINAKCQRCKPNI